MPISSPEDITGLRDWIRATDQSYGDGDPCPSLSQSSVLMATEPWDAIGPPTWSPPTFHTDGPSGRSYFRTVDDQWQGDGNHPLFQGPVPEAEPSHFSSHDEWTEFVLFRVNDLVYDEDRDSGAAGSAWAILHAHGLSGTMIIGVYYKDGTDLTLAVTNATDALPPYSYDNPDRVEFPIEVGQWYFVVAGLAGGTTLQARLASAAFCAVRSTATSSVIAIDESNTYGFYFGALGGSNGTVDGHTDNTDVAELGTYGPWIGAAATQDLFDYISDFYGLTFVNCTAYVPSFFAVIG